MARRAYDMVACSECAQPTSVVALTGRNRCLLCSGSGAGLSQVDLQALLYHDGSIEGAKGAAQTARRPLQATWCACASLPPLRSVHQG